MKVLLIQAHSPSNSGDLALLEESLYHLKKAFPQSEITVSINDNSRADLLPSGATYLPSLTRWVVTLSADRSWTWNKARAVLMGLWLVLVTWAKRLLGIGWLPKTQSQRLLLNAYYEADLIAVAAGGHLYAHRSLDISFAWSWLSIALGIFLKKPIVFLPQSFGPFTSAWHKTALRYLFDRSALILAREPISYALLETIHTRSKISLMPDVAFRATQAFAEMQSAAPKNSAHPQIGFTLMDWGSQNRFFGAQSRYEEAMVALAKHACREYIATVFFFAQCTGPTPDQDDRIIARRIHAQVLKEIPADQLVLIDRELNPDQLRKAYAALDVLVATRMHSAIFALSMKVPALVIGYLHKSLGIMQSIQLSEWLLNIKQIQSGAAIQKFDALWNARQAVRESLEQQLPQIDSKLNTLSQMIYSSVQKRH